MAPAVAMRPSSSSTTTTTSSPPATKSRNGPLKIRGLQHVSLCVLDVVASARFYSDVLGFTEIKRPSSFDFDGCWLFGYGLGIHLIQGEPVQRPSKINPRGDHLSFQADDLDAVQEQLDELGITWVRETVVEGGVLVTQIFLHDPDHNMVEICNCGLIPVVPVQEGKSTFSKRASIDMGTHARTSAAAILVSGAASMPLPSSAAATHEPAQLTVCGPGGCFPARPAPLSVPECVPCCGGVGGHSTTAAVAADCTAGASLLPSFTPHGVLHRGSDGGSDSAAATAVAVAAGSSPHLPRVRSRPSLVGGSGNEFAGCFDSARPLSDSSFLSPGGSKERTWLQQQQQQHQQNGADEMDATQEMEVTAAAAAAALSSPPPAAMVSVTAGGGGNGGGGGGGRG